MKTRQVARFMLASAAIFAGVGCGAEQGSGDPGAIGSTSEALQLFNPNVSVQFSGFLDLGSSKTLTLGGYNAAGNAVATSGILDTSGAGAFTALNNALPASLGEVEIAAIPGQTNKFLVAGGRTAIDGAGQTNTYIVELSGANLATAVWRTPNGGTSGFPGQLPTGKVIGLNNLQKCGTSNVIAIGGITDKGMKTITGTTATNDIQVFNYVATNNGVDSYWAPLTDGNATHVVTMQTKSGYHNVLHVGASDADFRIAGGATDSQVDAINRVEKLTVDTSCNATNASNSGSLYFLPEINAMVSNYAGATAAPRSRMASFKKNITATPPSQSQKTFDFVMAGGTDQSGVAPLGTPVSVLLYESGADRWYSPCNITAARIFPRSAGGTSVSFVTGVVPKATSTFDFFYNTTAVVDTVSTTGACGTGNALADSRVGSVVVSGIAAFGAQHVNTTVATLKTNVETF